MKRKSGVIAVFLTSVMVFAFIVPENAAGSYNVNFLLLPDGDNAINWDYVGPTTYFQDHFESGDFSAWPFYTIGTGDSQEVVTSPVHLGSYSGSFTTDGNMNEVSMRMKDLTVHTYTISYARFYFRATAMSLTTSVEVMDLRDSAFGYTGRCAMFSVTHSGGKNYILFNYRKSGGFTSATLSGVEIFVDTWYSLELVCERSLTDAYVEAWINGESQYSDSGFNNCDVSCVIDRIQVGIMYIGVGFATTHYIDSVRWEYGYIGEVDTYDDNNCGAPMATHTGCVGTAYLLEGEPDSNSTYIANYVAPSGGAAYDFDTFLIQDTSVTNYTIVSVSVFFWGRKNDTDSGGRISLTLNDGDSDCSTDNFDDINRYFTNYSSTAFTSSCDSDNWTWANINDLNLTVYGGRSAAGNGMNHTVTFIGVMITYLVGTLGPIDYTSLILILFALFVVLLIIGVAIPSSIFLVMSGVFGLLVTVILYNYSVTDLDNLFASAMMGASILVMGLGVALAADRLGGGQ